MYFVRISEQNAIVYCAVGIGSLSTPAVNFARHGSDATTQICARQCDAGTGFSPSTSVFNFQHHSNNSVHLFVPVCCCYHRWRGANSGNLPNSIAASEIG